MHSKQTDKQQPLSTVELDTLLKFLQRILATSASDTIRRVAKSLFTVLTEEKYR